MHSLPSSVYLAEKVGTMLGGGQVLQQALPG
jgi:hypothetical protein